MHCTATDHNVTCKYVGASLACALLRSWLSTRSITPSKTLSNCANAYRPNYVMSKRRVTYYYDGTPSSDPYCALSKHTNGRGHRFVHLRPRPPYETPPDACNTRPGRRIRHAGQDANPSTCARALFLLAHACSCLQRPKRATPESMTAFHTDEYIHFLHRVTPETAEELTYHGTRCEWAI